MSGWVGRGCGLSSVVCLEQNDDEDDGEAGGCLHNISKARYRLFVLYMGASTSNAHGHVCSLEQYPQG